jgi:hypothetical protein
MLLTKKLYGSEFSPTKDAPFGLRCGQMGSHRGLGHNAGWYNALGEKVGWGDFTAMNAERVMAEIPENELLILLSEEDSYWNFVSFGGKPKVKGDEYSPGIDYVADHSRYVFGRDICWMVIQERSWRKSEHTPGETKEWQDLTFSLVNKAAVKVTMKTFARELRR